MNDKIKEVRKLLLGYLAYLAKEKEMSIEYIADFTGFNPGTVERMLKGHFNPTLEQFIILAEAINCYFFIIDKEANEETAELMKNRWQQNKNIN